MLDRESTFADKSIIELLTGKFIPVALDQGCTRRQRDTEGDFYRQIAGQGPRNDFSKTTQGLYIADPTGHLIAYNNNRGPERIRGLLKTAIADYQPPAAVPVTRESTDEKFNPQIPQGAIVVRTSAKVLGGYEATNDDWQKIFHKAVSRDNLWIMADEQRELLENQMPVSLARRIARFHLVDDTRGEPPTWRLDEIRNLELSVTDGRITGSVELETADHARGFVGILTGVVAGSEGKVTEYTMVARGEFWGTGQYTMDPPKGKFPLVIAFQIADGNDVADAIAPHGTRGWVDGYLFPDR